MKNDIYEKYGMTPKELATKHFTDFKERNGEITPKFCPFCRGGQHNDKHTFYLDKEDGAYICHRQSCGEQGGFKDLLIEFNEIDEFDSDLSALSSTSKQYKKPDLSKTKPDLSDDILDWFDWRGISQDTVEKWDIREEGGNVVFPYRNRDGEEVLLKYRVPNRTKKEKKIWEAGGGKKVLWGLDHLDVDKRLIITEGELDCLALTEARIENVTSVPFGAEKYNWVENCWDILEQFNHIILWFDNDDPGKRTEAELANRLGKWRISIVQSEYKDPNRELVKEGPKSLVKEVENAEDLGGEKLIDLKDIEPFDMEAKTRIPSSIQELNHIAGGYPGGMVSVWTGKNESGKTTFLTQELGYAVNEGFKVTVYNGEMTHTKLKEWTELQMAGRWNTKAEHDDFIDDDVYVVPPDTRRKIEGWYAGKYWLYETTQGIDWNELLEAFKYSAMRYGTKLFLVDNLMSALTGAGGNNSEYYRQQSEFVGRIIQFARDYEIHVMLVAHPRKEEGVLSKYDIAGSGDISNRVDYVYSIERFDEDDINDKPELSEDDAGTINILKDRPTGRSGKSIVFRYDEQSRRVYSRNETHVDRQYNWENQTNNEEGEDLAPF